ncbi:MAG: hypothetical protein II776_03815, partial [Clostridia bacterium]|nr:hypothetical protein [Clostridia bacterium]
AEEPKDLTLTVDAPEGSTIGAVNLVKEGSSEIVTLPQDAYTFENGVLTIKDEYLKKLETGNYQVFATVGNGVTTAPFSVLAYRPTGDMNLSLVLWSAIALVSLAGATVVGLKIKKATER